MLENTLNQAPICQSCAMPIAKDEDFGTNEDGNQNEEYCTHCFQNGEFTNPNMTKEEMVDVLVGFADKMKMTKEKAKKMAEETLPKLKRWQ